MAEEKIARIAREIYENVGGTQNVKKLIHCMTRVRMTIIDDSKVNLAGLKAIDGVMGVVEDETLQVVIGPGTVNKVAQAMVETVGVRLGETFPSAEGQSIDDLMAKTKFHDNGLKIPRQKYDNELTIFGALFFTELIGN